MVESGLNQLARLWGIELEYRDVWGKSHSTSDETKVSLLRAMGLSVDVGTNMQTLLTEHETASRGQLVGPVQVVRETVAPIQTPLRVPKEHIKKHFEWTLIEEHGKHHSGIFVPERLETNGSSEHEHFMQCVFTVPATPGCGYHWIEIRECDGKGKPTTLLGKMQLIVTPEICYMPRGLREDSRVWGPAIQLYALKSGRNWGIGDFTDLKAIVGYCADAGAGIVGLNPLHSLFPLKPEHRSPYAPSSRAFLNFLYLDVEAVADFEECDEAKETVQSPEFQARLAALRDQELVDYPEVVTIKHSILEMLYEAFRKRHLDTESERGRAFRAFQAMGGKVLHGYGVFEALQEHCHSSLSLWGWPTWPEQYQKPQSQAVVEFASAYQERVEFFQYLQWQADLQLGSAGHLAMERGLKVGLYEDLAVSVDPVGFETWFYQNIYALDASIGAPPDDFNLNGQDWGLPPPIPRRLVEASYAPFVAALRFNMRYAGAIRIDHVMELMRLFWVPSGQSPSDGAYVRYPFHDLMGILALESQRNRCLVIGEDLGTVPEEIREALRAMGVLSFRLLYFEKDPDGNFRKPADLPDQAVVAVSTHDLPTLPGYWQGQDLIVRGELELFPTEELREAHTVGRSEDRVRLLFALKKEDLLPEGIEIDVASLPKMSPDLVTAVYCYLARSPAKILLFQLEDVLGQLDQINLPGTTTEYPNWQRKLPTLLESFSEDARLESLATALQLERGVGTLAPTSTPSREEAIPMVPRIPVATYRLQLNADFNFSRAAETTAYLKQLGISHCYISPYLKARPGSAHGYDIVDHGTLNPELGTIEEFEHLVHSLHQHGMGQILDFVPNHMAAGCDNPWWVDILENGQASEYAEFFDIAWHPLKDDLRGKVLIPILEDHYGAVLEKGLLRLAFDTQIGEFSLWYHEHRFPVDPASYTIILSHGIARLETRLEATGPQFLEFESLITAFENLPEHWETEEQKVAARTRDKEVLKRHLARLCGESPEIQGFVEENVVLFNGTVGEPKTYDLLHNLLQSQPYRLAYWRVASDEINYRRFFDINELGGLRMEKRKVFDETHRLVLSLIAQGKIQGLRIDHIDGLYDPRQYCQWLHDEIRHAAFLEPESAQKRAEAHEISSDADSVYVVVEKILAGHEQLSKDWLVHGTTGYDFANLLNGLFVDSSHERDMTRIYSRYVGRKIDFNELLYQCKKLIMNVAMASELNVLANELNRISESSRHTRDFTLNSLKNALIEVIACFPVYRTYVTGENVSVEDERHVNWAVGQARSRSRAADTSVYDFIRDVLLLNLFDEEDSRQRESVTEFAMRFQQFTGPVMAKGLEDTSFYIYNRLVSLNEVGGDPRRFGVSVSAFHWNNRERASQAPHAMLNTSTHDSKRGEDVRSRINVLSEVPGVWQQMVKRWSRINRSKKQKLDVMFAPSKNDEYALYQILIGAWPFQDGEDEGSILAEFSRRVEAYMIKAVREAKVHSSWINPNSQYEDATVSFMRALFEDPNRNRFMQEFVTFQSQIARLGMYSSLSQVLLKLTCPGVPDIYQGNEIWNLSLVDPDNRRPVGFARRRQMLEELQSFVSVSEEVLVSRANELLKTMEDGRIKLYVTWRTLALRCAFQDVFRGGIYLPLKVHGEKADNLCAFARQQEDRWAVVAAPRLYAGLCGIESEVDPLGRAVWSDTWVETPFCPTGTQLKNVFTGEILMAETRQDTAGLSVAGLLGSFPVALLTKA